MTIGKIDPRYGDASATAPPWDDIERLLTDAQLYWIITVRTDGRPHAVPLVGVWHDGAFAFCTGPEEQKQRNLDANPHVAVTTGTTGASGWSVGKDIVVEGTAVRVTAADALQALADAWFATQTWCTYTLTSAAVVRACARYAGIGVWQRRTRKFLGTGRALKSAHVQRSALVGNHQPHQSLLAG